MKQPIVAFLSGTVFAVGLVVAGMTDRLRVRAFLDIAGDWDPRLMLVMVFGIGVFAPVYRMGRARAVGEGAAKVYSYWMARNYREAVKQYMTEIDDLIRTTAIDYHRVKLHEKYDDVLVKFLLARIQKKGGR